MRRRARESKRISDGVGGYSTSVSSVPTDYNSIDLNKIYLERELELSLEGHAFFDLVRTGRVDSVLNRDSIDGFGRFINYKPVIDEVLPIPLIFLESNPDSITQNIGFEQYSKPTSTFELTKRFDDTTVYARRQSLIYKINNRCKVNGVINPRYELNFLLPI